MAAGNAQRGLRVRGDDPAALREAIPAVVDYRGDVTITRTDETTVVGYVFDCTDGGGGDATLRVLPDDGGDRVTIPLADVATVEVTGRDTAAGRSFESWVKRYVQKKLAGEAANIEAEPLED
ncbi:MAG: hypothetical protein GY715_08755 [Planctomycetes bacterium]|nr:hypothetical protein [Planctomycetota bacterium]